MTYIYLGIGLIVLYAIAVISHLAHQYKEGSYSDNVYQKFKQDNIDQLSLLQSNYPTPVKELDIETSLSNILEICTQVETMESMVFYRPLVVSIVMSLTRMRRNNTDQMPVEQLTDLGDLRKRFSLFKVEIIDALYDEKSEVAKLSPRLYLAITRVIARQHINF